MAARKRKKKKPRHESDIIKRRATLADGDHDNYPNGHRTTHRFRRDVKLRSNEEMSERHAPFIIRGDGVKVGTGPFVLSDDDILGKGSMITPHIDALGAKCCRGVYLKSKAQLAQVFRTHGEGLRIMSGTVFDADPDAGITHDDPQFGYDMLNRKDGYPCTELVDGKCRHHEDGETPLESDKPILCKIFPRLQSALDAPVPIKTCSYRFDDEGERTGSCDGCKGGLSF